MRTTELLSLLHANSWQVHGIGEYRKGEYMIEIYTVAEKAMVKLYQKDKGSLIDGDMTLVCHTSFCEISGESLIIGISEEIVPL